MSKHLIASANAITGFVWHIHQYVLPYFSRICRSIRLFSARSADTSTEPAAKHPSITKIKNAKQLLSICEPPFLVLPDPYALPSDRNCYSLFNAQSASKPIVNVAWEDSVESRPLLDRSRFPVDLKSRFAEVLFCRPATAICFPPIAKDIAANSYMLSAQTLALPVCSAFAIGSEYFNQPNDDQLAERFLRKID